MRVLVVTAHPILPLTHGGRVRTMGLAAGLVRAGATVDLLCPWAPGQPWHPFVHDGVRCIPHRFITNALRILPNRLLPPLVALSWQPFSFGPRRRLASASSYDVVQFEFCAYAAWMERLAGVTAVVYSAHNVEQDQHRGESEEAPLLRPWAGRVAALERRAIRAGDLVITCTDADASRLAQLWGGSAYAVIPNGFDERLLSGERAALRERARASLGIPPEASALLFVGGRARHNQQAVEFLERHVLPRLGAGGRLMVAGACADDLPPARDSSVLRLGYVEDLRPILAAADVAVNPIAYGSGSNLKMAEYLAAELPVVTTPIGVRGFEQHLGAVRVAGLDRFAEAVVETARAPARPDGGAVDVHEISWTRLGQRLAETYEELLRQGGAGRPP
jgi:glycosyltransferase involved in cell wall biosynthesis